MDKCVFCDYSFLKYNNKSIEYCPKCGKMLNQECPYCHDVIVVSREHCNNKIVLCERCGRMNKTSERECSNCGECLKKLEDVDVFFGRCVDYSRTNTYILKESAGLNIQNSFEIPIKANYSKALISNGKIYFWKEQGRDKSIAYCNILLDEKVQVKSFGDYTYPVNFGDIAEIEIFYDYYIVTYFKESLMINSTEDGSLIGEVINIRELSSINMPIEHYKAAILGKFLIIVLSAGNTEEILSLDVNHIANGNYANSIVRYFGTETDNLIKVEANPAINGNCAYFLGYSGKIHKFALNENSAKLNWSRINIDDCPNNFSAKQIMAADDDTVYFTCNAGNQSCLFKLENDIFKQVGSSDLAVDKISYWNDYIYALGKNTRDGNISFSQCKTDFNISGINGSNFYGISNVQDYYIVVMAGVPHLLFIYENKRNEFEIKCTPITRSDYGLVNSQVNSDVYAKSYEKPDFLVYDNYIISCQHEIRNNKIVVKRIRTD